jgi:outer membrane receptor protein involved in Fe transport
MAAAQEAPKPAPASKSGKTVGEVVVTGDTPALQTTIDRRSYSIANDLKAQGGSVADVLRNVPQVEVDVQGNVSLRGDPNVTILIDGRPSSQFQGDNKAQALQAMPAEQIERVEVVTNPSAEFRADGSGGVINLISKKAKGAGATGSLQLTVGDGHRAVVGVSGGYNSAKLNVTGDVNYRRDGLKMRSTDDRLQRAGVDQPFGFFEQDQITHYILDAFAPHASVDYDVTSRTRLGAEVRGNYSFFRVDAPSLFLQGLPTAASFERQLSVRQMRAAGAATVSLRQKLGAEGEAVVSLTHEELVDPRVRFGHTFDIVPAAPESVDEQRLNYRVHRTELKADMTQPFADGSKLKLGFDVDAAQNDYRNRGFRGASEAALTPDPTLTNLFRFRRTVAAAYVTYEKAFGDVTAQAGLRLEDDRQTLDQVTLGQVVENDEAGVYPSLHLAWKLDDSRTLSASYSHRIQRPDPLQFNAFRFLVDPLNVSAGNPRLKPQQTQSFELAYERRSGPAVWLTTLYYRETKDGPFPVLSVLPSGVFLTEPENLARGRLAGAELVASGKLGRTLTYNASGSVFWRQLDSLGPSFAPTRSLVAERGQGTLTWRPTADDLFQLNGFMYARGLTPQGTLSPVMGVDLGYRRKLRDRLFLLVTLQDFLHAYHALQANDTPLLIQRVKTDFDTRQARIGLTWSFGGGRPKDPGFEFQTGGGPPQ